MSIADRWPPVALGEVADVLSGFAFKSIGFNTEGNGMPLIRIRDVVSGSTNTFYTGNFDPRFVVKHGEILVGMDGDFNRSRWASDEALLNQRVCKVSAKKGLDEAYLFHLLPQVLQVISDRTPFVTVKHLSAKELKEYKIPLPPLAEQKRIAGILDQAAELCRLRTRALEKLNTLGQAIFYEMFGDWRTKPHKWPMIQIGDELEFLTSGSRGWAKYYSSRGAKFIRIQNVKHNEFDESDLAFVEAPESAEARRTKVKPGDVLLSITADLGRTAVVPNDIGEAHINQHLAILRLRFMDPFFVSAALSSPAGQNNIQKKNREGVKAGLNFDDIRGIEIPNPPRDMQSEYVLRTSKVSALVHSSLAIEANQRALFASLQHRAFRGEL